MTQITLLIEILRDRLKII